jgi:xanthine phosphoribosyltransferase
MPDPVPPLFVSWHGFHNDCRQLARRLMEHGPWHGLIAITRGGLIPAAIIARELNVHLVDTVCISSYQHDVQGGLTVLKSVEGDGDGYLVIDDLVDTGVTAKAVRKMLPKAFFATVYAKPEGRKMTDLFIHEVSQETWIHFPWDSGLAYQNPLIEE